MPCASGTHALTAAAALAELESERRWIASTFGFRATIVGPFAGASIVDCDERGVIDVGRLREEVDDYEGIVATNPFGLVADMNGLIQFSRAHGKVLIIDNAAAFVGFDRTDHAGVLECISFHHTKPYGFGEGGCLIVDRDRQDHARSVLDFGYRMEQAGGQRAMSNGKLSEPAAAFILARQITDREWFRCYRRQFKRILEIAKRQGFRPLIEEAEMGSGAYGNLPLIAPFSVSEDSYASSRIPLRKYYKPLAAGKNAADLYCKIVNVPAHRGMESVEDQVIEEALAGIIRSHVSRG